MFLLNAKLQVKYKNTAKKDLPKIDTKQQCKFSYYAACQEAFAKFDTKRRGLVSTKVLGDLLRQIGINPTKEELQVCKRHFQIH